MRKALLIILNYRFEILISFLVLLMAVATFNGDWIGDFWEHAGVVRELSYAPLSPKHSLYLLNKSSSFYSPYSLFLGLAARFTGFSVITIFSVVGMLNLVLLLYSFTAFVMSLYKDRKIVFYALLLTIFAWYMPWTYSGFISINTLAYTLPYPATFCMALMFLIFNMYYSLQKRAILYVLIAVLTAIIIISHPLTGIVCCVGLLSLTVSQNGFKLNRQNIITALTLLIAILIPLLWPYYSFYDLIMGAGDVYHGNNTFMYDRPIVRSFPALLAIPLLYIYFKKDKENPLLIMLLLLTMIYVYGYVSKAFSFGRVVSFMAIILHIYAGRYLVLLEETMKQSKLQKAIFFSVLLGVGILAAKHMEKIVYPFLEIKRPPSYEKYTFLPAFTTQYDVVLSDINTSLYVPAFGGKIVACEKPQAYIEDAQNRVNDVQSFFSDSLSAEQKMDIVKKYNVDYILVNKQLQKAEDIENFASAIGKIKFTNDILSLYAVDPDNLMSTSLNHESKE